MNHVFDFAAADREFYAPLEDARDEGEVFAPSRVPEGWRGDRSGVWTMWHRPGHSDLVGDGWKVHVSARPERLRQVLDVAAEVCFSHGVPFKHLSTRLFYWWTHQKYAQRPQSGKFVAAYPADVEAARRLMDDLRERLAGEDGPYVLTDRRYQGSRTVHYRYGAFQPRFRTEADGTRTPLMRDRNGRLIPDLRGVSFRLPEGIADPFRRPAPADGATPGNHAAPTGFGGFAVDSSVRYTNAGGTYRGHEVATGRRVFIKEARPHTGLRDDGATAPRQLREEWETLTALHALAPGLAPEPISYFRAWEHEFLVTEHVDGLLLSRWLAIHHPLLKAGTTAEDFAAFYARCERMLHAIESAVRRLHAVGWLFVDISPGNVLVGEDDAVRLIDFGSAHRLGTEFLRAGTPGYAPPEHLVGDDLAVYDDYGLASLAQHLLGPLHLVADQNPGVLAHLRHELEERAPVPPAMWARATRYREPGNDTWFPTPEQVSADPLGRLRDLRDRVADALVAMADVDHRARVFPTIPQGYLTNTVCVAYGTAGVVHALRHAGRELPGGLLSRLRRDALDKAGELAPGLYVGTAGVSWVLADCGLLDEARDLLAAADRHPLTGECATLYGGAAGVALAHLALYGHTRDERHVDRAVALAAALPPDDRLVPRLEPDDAVGLAHGRAGVALALAQLAGVTGEDGYGDRAVRLLHAELDRASDPEAAGLLFPVSAVDRRAMPYLYAGSAGMAQATIRCLRVADDERLTVALPRMLAPLHLAFTVMSGLFQGMAGYALTLADHAAFTGDEADLRASRRGARNLFKYAIPHRGGARYLGDQNLRFSADLWSGSAGVLLALDQVLDPRPDALFTVDRLVDGHTVRSGNPAPADRVPATVR